MVLHVSNRASWTLIVFGDRHELARRQRKIDDDHELARRQQKIYKLVYYVIDNLCVGDSDHVHLILHGEAALYVYLNRTDHYRYGETTDRPADNIILPYRVTHDPGEMTQEKMTPMIVNMRRTPKNCFDL